MSLFLTITTKSSMNLKVRHFFVAIGLLMFLLCSVPKADATPVFARQTGYSCAVCHFQQFPLLNAFGRNFKLHAYAETGTGKQGRIEDDNLSLPSTLNASFVSKLRYQKTDGASPNVMTNDGQVSFPDEAFLTLGGRLSKNIGFEIGLSFVPQDVTDGKILSEFKMPMTTSVDDITLSAIPFTTSAQGPAYGFELLNTGAVEFTRALEHAGETSAQQYLPTAIPATGVAFVVYHKYGYLNYTPYVPTQGSFGSSKPMSYFRGVVTPTLGDWDLGGGFQIWTGTSNVKSTAADNSIVTTTTHADAWAVDLQAQGKVGAYPLGLYTTYGNAPKTTDGNPVNIFNGNTYGDAKAWTISALFGVIPDKLALAAGYRKANTGVSDTDADNAITLGLAYMLTKNIQFQLNHSFYSGDTYTTADAGKNLTTLVLYSAF